MTRLKLKTGSRAIRTLGLAALGTAALAACDNASAVQTRDRAESEAARPAGLVSAPADAGVAPAKPAPITASRRETVDAKIARLYERNGADFGARSAEDYLAKAAAFIGKPPAGTETVRRPNGDTLLYQASTNTFAVADRDGVPRTMFKPTDGAVYWAEQKERAPTFGQRRAGGAG